MYDDYVHVCEREATYQERERESQRGRRRHVVMREDIYNYMTRESLNLENMCTYNCILIVDMCTEVYVHV